MVAKKLIILGLRRQTEYLERVIDILEAKEVLDAYDYLFCEQATGYVRENLKKLRKLRNDYCSDREFASSN